MLRARSPQAIDSLYIHGVEIKKIYSISPTSSVSVGSALEVTSPNLNIGFPVGSHLIR